MDFEINEVDLSSVVIILVIAAALVGFLVYNLYQAPLYDDWDVTLNDGLEDEEWDEEDTPKSTKRKGNN